MPQQKMIKNLKIMIKPGLIRNQKIKKNHNKITNKKRRQRKRKKRKNHLV